MAAARSPVYPRMASCPRSIPPSSTRRADASYEGVGCEAGRGAGAGAHAAAVAAATIERKGCGLDRRLMEPCRWETRGTPPRGRANLSCARCRRRAGPQGCRPSRTGDVPSRPRKRHACPRPPVRRRARARPAERGPPSNTEPCDRARRRTLRTLGNRGSPHRRRRRREERPASWQTFDSLDLRRMLRRSHSGDPSTTASRSFRRGRASTCCRQERSSGTRFACEPPRSAGSPSRANQQGKGAVLGVGSGAPGQRDLPLT